MKLYHNQKDAEKAQTEFEKVFSKKELPEDIPRLTFDWPEKKVWIPYACTATNLVTGTAQAVRLIEQGGLYVNNERVKSIDEKIDVDGEKWLFKLGKRKFAWVIPIYKPKSVND